MDTIDTLLTPLYYAVSAVLLGWHWLFAHLFGADSGVTWTLSIVGLVLVIRTVLIPLFVKQIRSARNMQVIQPKVKELQKKYGDDRERMSQELMKLYKETGTNPFASCLPILLQSPVLYALFRVLSGAAQDNAGGLHGLMTQKLAVSMGHATLFGAPISDKFFGGSGTLNTQIVCIVMIVLMVSAMFYTQLQLMRKNMPKSTQTGQFAQQQKLILYIFPLAFAVGGVSFPIGVLIYWLVSNVWTGGQQFVVIKNNPTPGTDAYAAYIKKHGHKPELKRKERIAARRRIAEQAEGVLTADGESAVTPGSPPSRARVQPKRTSRSQRRRPSSTSEKENPA